MTTQNDIQMVQPPLAPRPSDKFFNSVRHTGITRAPERWLGGVAGGIARRLGWDPMIVRGLFFLSTFLGGFGFLLYGAAWALLPEAIDGRIHLQEAIRGHFNPALIGAGLMFLRGLTNTSIFRLGSSAAGAGLSVFSALLTVGQIAFWGVAIWLFAVWIRNRKAARIAAGGASF
ncbi:MAG: PspC domain-containing protein [Cellulomonadaceae bacterium]|jgi:phage shock protein PspC (stress-responsive transcriptional regulator)|nr:PspC domain-containing protein [Cellulomonadaceae bacterium]